jgi:putative transcriptional regulator
MSTSSQHHADSDHESFEGKLLIAMPTISEGCFARSVVLMCAHSQEGAMGLIINQRADGIRFSDLLQQLDIIDDEPQMQTSQDLHCRAVHVGGPVETSRGFVLHTPDYFVSSSTVRVEEDICLTSTLDILRAMSAGLGPKEALLALGYSGWGPGQLESEFSHNGWLHCNADPELVFDSDLDTKYERALSKLGVNPSHLVSDAGHA